MLAPIVAPGQAWADPTQEEKAQAQALFESALKLYKAKDFAGALPSFTESNRLDPAGGTMLYMGECYAQLGKTASAWGQFMDATDFAMKTQNSARAAQAKQRATKIEPTLSKLSIVLAPGVGNVAGLEVTRDGKAVGRAQIGIEVPVDPGPHVIRATAPGKIAFEQSITIGAEKDRQTISIPTPADAPPAEPATAPPPPSAGPESPPPSTGLLGPRQAILGLAIGGVGIVALGFGGFFGIKAKSKLDDSNNGHCQANDLCDATGVDLRSSAKSAALGSTIAFGLGIVAIAGGAALYVTAPKSQANAAPKVGFAPVLAPQYGGLALHGGF